MDTLDVTKEVAERILLRAMEPVRKALTEAKELRFTDPEQMGLTVGTLKEMDKDLGAIGLTLANRYREQEEFRTTLTVAAQENVRLFSAVSALSELLEEEKKNSKALADALAKSEAPKEVKWGSS